MIVDASINSQILAMLDKTSQAEAKDAKQQFADELTSIIVDAIKSATITVKPGVIIVAGSPSTQTNVSPIIIGDSIS